MLSGEVSVALRTYSLRMSRELQATRRAIVTLGTASLLATSAWLMAVALDGRMGADLPPVTQVRYAPPSPQVTLRPLPVEAALWRAAPDVPPLSR